MKVQPVEINDHLYHPIVEAIIFYPPPDFSLRRGFGKSKSGAAKRRKAREKLYDHSSRCYYCKRELLFEESTIDHKIPRSKGGSNKFENFVLACKNCNREKGSISFEEFVSGLK